LTNNCRTDNIPAIVYYTFLEAPLDLEALGLSLYSSGF